MVKNWSLPGEPLFSKVNLLNSDAQISVTAYLIFAIAYIIVFGFIILGLYQLNRTTKLFAGEKIFQQEVGSAFKIAGRSFLAYAFGTLIIDIAFLAWANTSNLLSELLSTELLVFLILGYLMLFLADVFKRGLYYKRKTN